jgi:hypothetical protein
MSTGASSFTSGSIGDGAAVGGWAITLVLTFLLIGLPTIYLLVVSLATDDAFDLGVSDVEERVRVERRAQGYASGRDVHAGFEQPAAGRRPVVAAEATISFRGGRR